MLFNKNQKASIEVKKPVAPAVQEELEDAPVVEDEADNAVFSLNTEVANNSFILHLNETIKELKYELLKYDPCIKDMRIYVDALKADIVALVQLKQAFVRK